MAPVRARRQPADVLRERGDHVRRRPDGAIADRERTPGHARVAVAPVHEAARPERHCRRFRSLHDQRQELGLPDSARRDPRPTRQGRHADRTTLVALGPLARAAARRFEAAGPVRDRPGRARRHVPRSLPGRLQRLLRAHRLEQDEPFQLPARPACVCQHRRPDDRPDHAPQQRRDHRAGRVDADRQPAHPGRRPRTTNLLPGRDGGGRGRHHVQLVVDKRRGCVGRDPRLLRYRRDEPVRRHADRQLGQQRHGYGDRPDDNAKQRHDDRVLRRAGKRDRDAGRRAEHDSGIHAALDERARKPVALDRLRRGPGGRGRERQQDGDRGRSRELGGPSRRPDAAARRERLRHADHPDNQRLRESDRPDDHLHVYGCCGRHEERDCHDRRAERLERAFHHRRERRIHDREYRRRRGRGSDDHGLQRDASRWRDDDDHVRRQGQRRARRNCDRDHGRADLAGAAERTGRLRVHEPR